MDKQTAIFSMDYVNSHGRGWTAGLPFNGENMGSIPLGRAKKIKHLTETAKRRVQFVPGRHFGWARANANGGELTV
jgi:hypothetical protein